MLNVIDYTMDKIDKAYEGKLINYQGSKYTLEKERQPGMCMGCDLYNRRCTTNVTRYCTQGFILKAYNK